MTLRGAADHHEPRGVDILVHNVGHHDLYLLLEGPDGLVPARPRGPHVSTAATRALELIRDADVTLLTHGDRTAGLRLEHPLPLDWDAAACARRCELRDSPAVAAGSVRLVGYYAPLLAVLLPEWLGWVARDARPVLLLASSAPRQAQLAGTGTQEVAELLEWYVRRAAPQVEVVRLPAQGADPYAFSELDQWVRDDLLPVLRSRRRQLVERQPESWQANMRVRTSLSTGTTPMLHAIAAGMRRWRPFSLHIPGARRWGPLQRVFEVRGHEFVETEQRPAVEPASLDDPALRLACEQMASWRGEVLAAREEPSNLEPFWHRKGNKVVLAVLVVESPEGREAIRSINVEVSLPTGTLCAERNAIGTALARRPTLQRRDIQLVAVLSIDDQAPNPLAPCGACREWLGKIAEVNPDFRVVTFTDADMTRVHVDELLP